MCLGSICRSLILLGGYTLPCPRQDCPDKCVQLSKHVSFVRPVPKPCVPKPNDPCATPSAAQVADTTMVTACAPPGGGRQELTPRFMRHFNMLSVPSPSDPVMRHIFGSILTGFLSNFQR